MPYTSLLPDQTQQGTKTILAPAKIMAFSSNTVSFERVLKALSRRLAFTKRSNLIYFLVLSTTLAVFILGRINAYLLPGPAFCDPYNSAVIPGECYWLTKPLSRFRIGYFLHLTSVIPGSLLAIVQFIPSIRTHRPAVHQTLGYACWTCGVLSIVSALMIWDSSFGGTPTAKAAIIFLAAVASVGHFQAYVAIKDCRIADHRKWMLRTWGIMGSIVTMRPAMGIIATGVTLARKYGVPGEGWYGTVELPCETVHFMLNEGWDIGDVRSKVDFWSSYGAVCAPGLVGLLEPASILNGSMSSPVGAIKTLAHGQKVKIVADLFSKRIELFTAALDLSAGPAILVAMFAHAVAVEVYLSWTREEEERLRKVGDAKKRASEKVVERLKLTADNDRGSKSAELLNDLQKGRKDLEEKQRELSKKALAGQNTGQ